MSGLLRSTSAALAGCCLTVAALLACGGAPRPLPAPVRVAPPALPLPAGAALTVRVDLASLRDELGATLAQQLLLDSVSAPESAAPRHALLEHALARASVLWVALPAAGPLEEAERILLLRGHFSNLPVDGLGSWRPGPAGFESLDVANTALEASGYARVYRLDNAELLVWAPRAELATVERTLARRQRPTASDEARLEPPERGAVSVAARPGPLLALYARRYPELVERFRGLQKLEAFAEPTAGTWRADLFLDFGTAEQASGASAVLERLKLALAERACAVGVVARALSVSSFERNLRLQAWLEGAELESVRACVLGGGCCA